MEKIVPRGKWNLGRVLEAFPGKDGIEVYSYSEERAFEDRKWRTGEIDPEMLYTSGRKVRSDS